MWRAVHCVRCLYAATTPQHVQEAALTCPSIQCFFAVVRRYVRTHGSLWRVRILRLACVCAAHRRCPSKYHRTSLPTPCARCAASCSTAICRGRVMRQTKAVLAVVPVLLARVWVPVLVWVLVAPQPTTRHPPWCSHAKPASCVSLA